LNPAAPADRPEPPTSAGRAAGPGDVLLVLRRRWLLVLAAIACVATAAFVYSSQQQAVYSASANVLLSRQNLATSLSNITDPGATITDYSRVAQTQADVATSPEVIRLALKNAGLAQSRAATLRDHATVKAKPNADILTFEVQDHKRSAAIKLTNALATSYQEFRLTLDTAGVNRALTEVRRRIRQLRGSDGTLRTSLENNEQRLSSLQALQTSNAFVVKASQRASKVSPKPVLALIVGLLFGTLVGVALAFLRDRMDTRVRDTDEIGDQLGLPLLGRIPELPKRLRQSDDLVMFSEPHGQSAEAYQDLRTNIEFSTIDTRAQTIMITSAVQAEGKSTTIANLALACARVGGRVVIVDLDLRRPYLAKFFDLEGQAGVTEVALDRVSLQDALTAIDITRMVGSQADPAPSANGRASTPTADPLLSRADAVPTPTPALRVLTSGSLPPETAQFVGSGRLKDILVELRRDADLVLIDAPPLMSVSDALKLSAHADGVLFVARRGVMRRTMFKELRRIFALSPTPVLGFIATAVPIADSLRYGYGYGYVPTSRAQTETVLGAAPSRKRFRPRGSKTRS